jgi:hypothetical protein
MRAVFQTLPLLLLSFALSACGAGGKGGSSEQSAFEELSGLTAALQAQLDETAKPINETDSIVESFVQIPKDLSLSADDYKEFVISSVNGEMTVPGGVDEKGKETLTAFSARLKMYVQAIEATPANAEALGVKLGEALVSVPVLVTKVEGQSQLTINNPLASKAAKEKAKKESAEAKALGDQVTEQIKGIIEQAKALPQKAQEALPKFVEALKGAGIDSLEALKAAPGKVAKDTVEGVKDGAAAVVETAKDSAEGSAEAAQDAAQ